MWNYLVDVSAESGAYVITSSGTQILRKAFTWLWTVKKECDMNMKWTKISLQIDNFLSWWKIT